MMNNRSMQTVIDPAFHGRMPPVCLDKQALHFASYFAYEPRKVEGAGFPAPWTGSKASLLDGRSPVSHLPGMEGQNRVFYRQDDVSSEKKQPRSSPHCHVPVKQGFTLYSKSPVVSTTTAATPVTVREQSSRGENTTPPPENSVYLAVPKPLYGQNLCCNELGCMMGHRYVVEHGSPRPTKTVYPPEWIPTDAHYTDRPPLLRKAADAALQQQRPSPYELGATPPKTRVATEKLSPRPARTLPPTPMEPNYSSYPCAPTRALFRTLGEQSQLLTTPPRSYPGLYPSHPAYEHLTSEVYQEHSSMSKYGHLTQYPVFYYPQPNEEPQKSMQCKNLGSKQREHIPVIIKHAVPVPPEHYIVPQPFHGEIPLPRTETLPGHSLMHGFDYPCFLVPRIHLNADQVRMPLVRPGVPPGFHGNGVSVSSSGQERLHHRPGLHKDKDEPSPHVEPAKQSLPFLCRDLTSPTKYSNQQTVSTHNMKFFPSISSLLTESQLRPPGDRSANRVRDPSSCESHLPWVKQPTCLPVSPAAWMPLSPGLHHAAGINPANVQKIIYCPPLSQGNVRNSPKFSSGSSVIKGCLKRSLSSSPPDIKIKREKRDCCETESTTKGHKSESDTLQVEIKPVNHPMPVIDSVFSLAPYQTDACPNRLSRKAVDSPERFEVKPDVRRKLSNQGEERAVISAVYNSGGAAAVERPVGEGPGHRKIKVEKVEPQDTEENTEETAALQQDFTKVIIKQEHEEGDPVDPDSTLVVRKCEADDPESEPSPTDDHNRETSHKPKFFELTSHTHSAADTCTSTERTAIAAAEPQTTTQASESNFRNMPRQSGPPPACNILLQDVKPSSLTPPPEKSPTAASTPKPEPQMPVRKHFLELHQSLCKLISKSVSASSEHELKAWLSQLHLTEPSSQSAKVQKVSCLLGMEAREKWINEEMMAAFHSVLQRLREYTSQKRCPFPHVMRTGAVFLPMLVIKELLFPTVQSSFIDQVLHEHKVELRPTTLSEEKILIQLHKRACSSRLRRLMSLKHLPDIYSDVVNLLYYACVCKHLGLDVDAVANRDKDHHSEETPVFPDFSPPSVSTPEPVALKPPAELKSPLSKSKTKSRVKSSSRRMFLDTSSSEEEEEEEEQEQEKEEQKEEEEEDEPEKTVVGGASNEEGQKISGQCESIRAAGTEEDLEPPPPYGLTSESSWMCPLSLDQLSSSCTDTKETEETSTPRPGARSPGAAASAVESKSCSGMILKLKKMFGEGVDKKRAHYRAVSYSGTLDETHSADEEMSHNSDLYRRSSKASHRWQRTGKFSQTLRPIKPSSKGKHGPLQKIKYCPYLSACHSAEHRSRRVLRSAVHRARRAMRLYYPDLVGKRIHHLYEEDDKSEVWYSGEVIGVHEAHSNPLKTIFEVKYDSEPEWKYYLELLIDYKKGWLRIEE